MSVTDPIRFARRWSVLRGISAFSLAWGLRFVVGLAVSIALYRYFGASNMGVLAIATSVVGLMTFIIIETEMVVVSRLAGTTPAATKRVVTANYAVKMLNRAAVAALLIGGASFVETFYRLDGLAAMLGVLAAGQMIAVLYGPVGPEVLQGLRRYRQFAVQSAIALGGQVAAVVVTMLSQQGLLAYLVYGVVFEAAASVYGWHLYWSLRAQEGWSSIRVGRADVWAEAVSLVRASIPVSLNQLLFKSYLYLANLFAGRWYEPAVVGYLSFASNVINRANSTANATLSTVFLPFFTELKAKQRDELRELYERGYHTLLLFSGTATVSLALFAKEVTVLIGGSQFLPAVILLQLLSLQLVFRLPLQVLRMVYFAFERTWALFWVFAIKTASEIALILLLTRWFDVRGIVLAQVGAYAIYAGLFAAVGFRLVYGDWLARTGELGRDLGVLVAFTGGVILIDLTFAPSLLQKLVITATGLAATALWVRAGQVSGRRLYLLGR